MLIFCINCFSPTKFRACNFVRIRSVCYRAQIGRLNMGFGGKNGGLSFLRGYIHCIKEKFHQFYHVYDAEQFCSMSSVQHTRRLSLKGMNWSSSLMTLTLHSLSQMPAVDRLRSTVLMSGCRQTTFRLILPNTQRSFLLSSDGSKGSASACTAGNHQIACVTTVEDQQRQCSQCARQLMYYILIVVCTVVVRVDGDSGDIQYLHIGLFTQSQNYAPAIECVL